MTRLVSKAFYKQQDKTHISVLCVALQTFKTKKKPRKVKPKPPKNTKQIKRFLPCGFLRCLLECPPMVARF